MRNHPRYEEVIFDDKRIPILLCPYKDAFVFSENPEETAFIHEQIEVKYFTHGSATIIVGDEIVEANEGDIVFINPYEIHTTVMTVGAKYHLMLIDLEFFNISQFEHMDLKQIFVSQKTAFSHIIRNNKRMGIILKTIMSEYTEQRDDYMAVIKCLLYEFFVLMIRDYVDFKNTNVIREERLRQNALIEPAIGKIMSDYSSIITLGELADLCNMCKYHFCRVFKGCTGMSPMEYLMEYRIKNADILLRTTGKSIADISFECGFGDSAYFSRCYKKCRGMSPSAARKNASESN